MVHTGCRITVNLLPEQALQNTPALNTEAILHALKFRRSIRQYKKESISKEILDELVEAARYTFLGAPCLIIVAADHGGAWDAGLASQSIELTALSNNLGALYSGYLVNLINQNDSLKEWLGIPDCLAKTCMLLGYPNVEYYRSAPRKPANVIWK